MMELKPSSPGLLALVLADLAVDGYVERLFRVESVSGGGIGDFPNRQEVPLRILDWRRDVEVRVAPENVRVVFRIPGHQ